MCVKTSPSFTDAAMGRIAHGIKASLEVDIVAYGGSEPHPMILEHPSIHVHKMVLYQFGITAVVASMKTRRTRTRALYVRRNRRHSRNRVATLIGKTVVVAVVASANCKCCFCCCTCFGASSSCSFLCLPFD